MTSAGVGVNAARARSSISLPIVVAASLALLVGVAVAPPAALADRFRGGRVAITVRPFAPHPLATRPLVPHKPFRHTAVHSPVPHKHHHHPVVRPFVPHKSLHHPFGLHKRFHRPFVHSFIPGGSVVVYATPPVTSYSSAYYAPPAVYGAPTANTVWVAPSPPPPPSVVEYPTGRYELRGDGISSPYTWVWIPNPPPPPAAPPPAEPAPVAPPSGRGASDDPSPPPHHGQVYRWTDPEGVIHLTDRLDAVPEQYRPVALDRAPSLH